MNVSMTRLVFAVLAAALVGIGAAAAEHKGLAGTSWQLLQLGPNGALSENLPTLSFSPTAKCPAAAAAIRSPER